MELSVVRPRTFIVKMNIHCKACEKKVKRLLKNINGVHSIDQIDSEQGKVTISGTVDPQTLVSELRKSGKIRAEVLWEQQNNNNNNNHNHNHNHNHDNMQIVEAKPLLTNVIYDDDPHMAAQLQKLSEIQGLKNVELTYSKTVKLTFNGDHKVEVTNESMKHSTEKIVTDDSNGQAKNHGDKDEISCVGHDGRSSCCHVGLPRVCAMHGQYGWPPEAYWCTGTPCPPPPPWSSWAWPQPESNFDPSAPPLPAAYSYYSQFSDENTNGYTCSLM